MSHSLRLLESSMGEPHKAFVLYVAFWTSHCRHSELDSLRDWPRNLHLIDSSALKFEGH